jgi:hypothetical protein
MKIQPIFKQKITEVDFSTWEKNIQALMHPNFQVVIQSLQAININIYDFVAKCEIKEKVNFEISAFINEEKFYFSPAPHKSHHIVQFEKFDFLNGDLRKINDKILCHHGTDIWQNLTLQENPT